MRKIHLTEICNITTGKLDSNAAEKEGIYPYFTCAPEPLAINTCAFDCDAILLAGNNASGKFHCRRYSGKFNAYQRTYVITAKEGYDIDYIYYSLKINLQNLKRIAQGSQTKFLTMQILDKFTINNIPLESQQKLAKILIQIDSKIDNNNKINYELEKMAKTIYDYWFLQFEFPNEEGKPYKSSGGKMIWNEELEREIPEGWKTIKLQDVFSFVKGKIPRITFDNSTVGAYPYITIDVANGGKCQYCLSDDMPVCNGEVIMVMDGAASGDIYIGNRGVLGSTFAMLKKKSEDISDALIYVILSSRKNVYKKVNTGSTVPHANKKFIENMRVPVADNMSSFSRVFDEIYKKIELTKRENQELTSLRDFLLPLLMNGQVSFKE